jgi:hypothetical protein
MRGASVHTRRTARWGPDDVNLKEAGRAVGTACQAPTLRGRPSATQVWRVRLDPQAVCRSGAAVRDEKDARRPCSTTAAERWCGGVWTRARAARRLRTVCGTRSRRPRSTGPYSNETPPRSH